MITTLTASNTINIHRVYKQTTKLSESVSDYCLTPNENFFRYIIDNINIILIL